MLNFGASFGARKDFRPGITTGSPTLTPVMVFFMFYMALYFFEMHRNYLIYLAYIYIYIYIYIYVYISEGQPLFYSYFQVLSKISPMFLGFLFKNPRFLVISLAHAAGFLQFQFLQFHQILFSLVLESALHFQCIRAITGAKHVEVQ